MYDDAQYAGTRLNNTVVLLKIKPIYVVRVLRNLKALVTYDFVNNGNTFEVDCSALNCVAFKLGFVNTGAGVEYLSRRTMRHDWRQGLRPNNVHTTGAGVEYKDIAQALRQRYPTFPEAVKRVRLKGTASCAWCQDFALLQGGIVKWRYENVGKLDDRGDITLDNKFKFLRHQLTEVTYGCCKVL